MQAKRHFLALCAILVCSLVLRPPLAAVGPLLPEISGALGLSTLDQGVLSSIPVLSFGLGAFVGPWFAKRFGLERSMVLMLSALVLAIGLRGWFGFASLLLGTAISGLAIAVANVLLPSVVRERFPGSVAKVTAAYTSVLAVSASFAAATAFPTSQLLGDWNLALMVWLGPGLIALFLWWALNNRSNTSAVTLDQSTRSFAKPITAYPTTWALFIFFGFQSLGFYAILAWLPTLLLDRGFTPASAGGLLGLATIVGVPTGLLLSSNFGRIPRLDWAGFLISCITLSGFALLMVPGFETLAAIFIGLGQAATFPLSLTLISISARDPARTTSVSAFVQGGGYLLSAVGTFAFSSVRDLTGGWDASIVLLLALTAIQALSSFVAGGRAKIG